MIRRVAALVLALTLHPALVRAQDLALTITVPQDAPPRYITRK